MLLILGIVEYTFVHKEHDMEPTHTIDGMQCIVKQVHIDTLRKGDYVIHDGKLQSVPKISYGGFYGTAIFGDSYHGGNKPVTKVTILRMTPSGWKIAA